MARSRASKSRARSSGPQAGRSSSSGRRRAGSRPAADEAGSRGDKPRSRAKKAAKKTNKRAKEQPFAPNEREQREGVRLQKFIASAGVASRRKAEELIVGGLVEVNGRRVTELGTRVYPGRDRVSVRGEPIAAEAKVYYVLNKPDEVVCSAAGSVDERGRPTVLSLMHGVPERLFPVGRLDYHSRGVVLLTNDGELAAALTHPRHGVVKTYHVKFQGKLSPEQEQALRDGVVLDDGAVTRPLVELFAFRETQTNVWYQVGLAEGLNRQLRRMGDAIGHPVLKLIRVAIGDITADGLAEGEFRPLSPTEVGQLLASVKLEPVSKRPAGSKRSAAPKPRLEGAPEQGQAKPRRKPAPAKQGRGKPRPEGAPAKPAKAKPGAPANKRSASRAKSPAREADAPRRSRKTAARKRPQK